MEIPKIVQDLLDEKGRVNNTIDLDAYAHGLLDMHNTMIRSLSKRFDVDEIQGLLYEK